MEPENILEWIVVGLAVAAVSLGAYLGGEYMKFINRPVKLEEGFINLSDIETNYHDDDNNGKQETNFRFKETDYHLKFDEKGRPYFQDYSINTDGKPRIVVGDYDSRKMGIEKTVSDK